MYVLIHPALLGDRYNNLKQNPSLHDFISLESMMLYFGNLLTETSFNGLTAFDSSQCVPSKAISEQKCNIGLRYLRQRVLEVPRMCQRLTETTLMIQTLY